jgi:hypothetical protein
VRDSRLLAYKQEVIDAGKPERCGTRQRPGHAGQLQCVQFRTSLADPRGRTEDRTRSPESPLSLASLRSTIRFPRDALCVNGR